MSSRRIATVLAAFAIFGLFVAFVASAGQVSVRGGVLNVSDALNAGILYVDVLSGKIGLGTESPAYVLDVNGTVRIQNSTGANLLLINSSNGKVTVTGDFSSGCPEGMAALGSFCIDRYEASYSTCGTTGNGYCDFDDVITDSGLAENGTKDSYSNTYPAISESGYKPLVNATWFQAQIMCADAGKRLCTNAEWQLAASGTYDPGSNDADNGENTKCNTNGATARRSGLAGSTSAGTDSCISVYGAEDMIGNVWEWTADWTQGAAESDISSSLSESSSATYGSDYQYAVRDANNQGGGANFPAAFLRGGSWSNGADAGSFALILSNAPSKSLNAIGFRCCK